MANSSARRYNNGKLRYSLLPHRPIRDIVDVYTRGAHKYTIYEDEEGNTIYGKDISLAQAGNLRVVDDGADNWRKGQDWTKSMESVKRHIAAWDAGEDIDLDLGTYHLANAAWGLLSLLEYNYTKREFDDRNKALVGFKKFGFDIDSVLGDFTPHFLNYLGLDTKDPVHWYDPRIMSNFPKIINDKEFWLTMPVLNGPETIVFEPNCYITARSIPVEWTEEWLNINGFPVAEVVSIGRYDSKVKAAQNLGIEAFLDDKFENYVELNAAGIECYLYTASHNLKYGDVPNRVHTIDQFNKLISIKK
jgi:hypothetical protein